MNKQTEEIYIKQDGKVFKVINIGCYVDAYVLEEVKES